MGVNRCVHVSLSLYLLTFIGDWDTKCY